MNYHKYLLTCDLGLQRGGNQVNRVGKSTWKKWFLPWLWRKGVTEGSGGGRYSRCLDHREQRHPGQWITGSPFRQEGSYSISLPLTELARHTVGTTRPWQCVGRLTSPCADSHHQSFIGASRVAFGIQSPGPREVRTNPLFPFVNQANNWKQFFLIYLELWLFKNNIHFKIQAILRNMKRKYPKCHHLRNNHC